MAFSFLLTAAALPPRTLLIAGFYNARTLLIFAEHIHFVHFDELNDDFFDFLSRGVFGTNFNVFEIIPFDLLLSPSLVNLPCVSQVLLVSYNDGGYLF